MEINGERPPSVFWLIYFLLTFCLIAGVFAFCVYVPCWLVGCVWSPARNFSGRLLRDAGHRILGIQPWLKAETQIPLDLKPGLTISNHRSHLDGFILISTIPGLRILARDSLFKIPIFGTMMVLTGQIKVKRGNVQDYMRVQEEIRTHLLKGERVHIFPEMTRCPEGLQGTQEFFLSPFHIAMQTRVLIYPIAIRETDRAWPKGKLGLRPGIPVTVKMLPPVDPKEFADAEGLRQAVRSRINEALLSS